MSAVSSSLPKKFTTDEQNQLVLLGTIAGSPGIIEQAIKSGNIFDPLHMKNAKAMAMEWETGVAVLQAIIDRKAKNQAKFEELQCIGLTFESKPSPMEFDDVKAMLAHMQPSDGWKLRVGVADRVVDFELGNEALHLWDMFYDVTTILPRGSYTTWIVRGEDEPEKLEIGTV